MGKGVWAAASRASTIRIPIAFPRIEASAPQTFSTFNAMGHATGGGLTGSAGLSINAQSVGSFGVPTSVSGAETFSQTLDGLGRTLSATDAHNNSVSGIEYEAQSRVKGYTNATILIPELSDGNI